MKVLRLLCAGFVLFAGCQPRESGPSARTEEKPTAVEDKTENVLGIGTGAAAVASPGTGTSTSRSGGESVPQSPQPASPPSPRETLLVMRNSPIIGADDFSIGPLEMTGENREPERAVLGFVEGLADGIVDQRYVQEDRHVYLERSLEYYLERGFVPVFVRIGALEGFQETGLRSRLRLFGSEGRTECQIFLSYETGAWKVYDFQGDLALLGEPYIGPDAPFEPSESRMDGPGALF